MARVPGGEYRAFYPVEGERETAVPPFLLDVLPVTNAQFLEFVRESPRWRRSQVPRIFAEGDYLSHWRGDLELGERALPDRPLTFVSWFAAAAYCEHHGKRLPSEAEWELAASPGPGEDEREDVRRRVLAFYSRPRMPLPAVGGTPPNRFGVRDLHGVLWEWIDDFNASFAHGDDRSRDDESLDRVCGGAAIGVDDQSDYATFMRIAFRSSLDARYTIHHLGFRCARSLR